MKNALPLLLCLILFNSQAIAQNHKQKTAAETVRAFVKWYDSSREKLDALETNTINMGALESKASTPYSINFKGVEKYIARLSGSGFFSEEYFTALRSWFKEADSSFKKNPQDDGPPEGFQADRFFLTQDDFLQDIKNIDKINITEKRLNNAAADVLMLFPYCNITYHYRLSCKKEKWQIDSIKVVPSVHVPQSNADEK